MATVSAGSIQLNTRFALGSVSQHSFSITDEIFLNLPPTGHNFIWFNRNSSFYNIQLPIPSSITDTVTDPVSSIQVHLRGVGATHQNNTSNNTDNFYIQNSLHINPGIDTEAVPENVGSLTDFKTGSVHFDENETYDTDTGEMTIDNLQDVLIRDTVFDTSPGSDTGDFAAGRLTDWTGLFASGSSYYIEVEPRSTLGSTIHFGFESVDIVINTVAGTTTAMVLGGETSLDSNISFTDDLAVTVGTRDVNRTQSDRRRPTVYQHVTDNQAGIGRVTTNSDLYNWGSVSYSDHLYLESDYAFGGYYQDPYNTQNRLDYELFFGESGSADSRCIPEFDFSEFHSATLDSYQLEFEYKLATPGTLVVKHPTASGSVSLVVGSGDVDTWLTASISNLDGAFVANYNGLLQTLFYRVEPNPVASGQTRVRNIQLTATFTGRTGIKGNKMVSGAGTSQLVFDTYSGSTAMTNPMPVDRLITTTFALDRFKNAGSVFPVAGGIVAVSDGQTGYTPTVSVRSGVTVLDTENVNQNGRARQIGYDIGRAQSGSWQGSVEGDYYDPYNTDYYPTILHNTLDYGTLQTEDLANLSIEYDNFNSYTGGADSSLDYYQNVYNDVHFIYQVPQTGQPDTVTVEFAQTATGNLIVTTGQEESISCEFGGVDRGGLLQLGQADFDVQFGVDLDPTGIGRITPMPAKNLVAEYYPAGLPSYYNFIHEPVDAGGNPIDYSHFVRRAPLEFDFDWAYDKTVGLVGVVRVPECRMTASWSQSTQAIGVGVIIDNAETETFEFALTSVVVVLKVPNRYRELLLMPETRTYSLRTETRDRAVNTESRQYLVPEQTRQIDIETETRTLKQTGYNS